MYIHAVTYDENISCRYTEILAFAHDVQRLIRLSYVIIMTTVTREAYLEGLPQRVPCSPFEWEHKSKISRGVKYTSRSPITGTMPVLFTRQLPGSIHWSVSVEKNICRSLTDDRSANVECFGHVSI